MSVHARSAGKQRSSRMLVAGEACVVGKCWRRSGCRTMPVSYTLCAYLHAGSSALSDSSTLAMFVFCVFYIQTSSLASMNQRKVTLLLYQLSHPSRLTILRNESMPSADSAPHPRCFEYYRPVEPIDQNPSWRHGALLH